MTTPQRSVCKPNSPLLADYVDKVGIKRDRRRIKRLVQPGLGFKNFAAALRTIAGYEAMVMIRKTQMDNAPASGMRAQRNFTVALFSVAA